MCTSRENPRQICLRLRFYGIITLMDEATAVGVRLAYAYCHTPLLATRFPCSHGLFWASIQDPMLVIKSGPTPSWAHLGNT